MSAYVRPERIRTPWLQRHLPLLVLLFGCALALVLRFCLIPFESNDYVYFLQNWYEALADGGGLSALQKPLPDCNYTLAYLTLLAPLAAAGVPALVGVKAVSIVFDFLLAGAVAWLLRIEAGVGRMGQIAGAILTLFLPTVFFNSCMWGQCDAIYVTFCLLALGALLKRKGFLACILLGAGFAFKMQAAFFLPFFVLAALIDHRVRLWHFAMIPAMIWLSGLPAILMGAAWWLPFSMCAEQLKSAGSALSHNCPNLPWLFSIDTADILHPAFLVFGFATLLFGAAIVLRARCLSGRNIVLFAAWSIMTCVCFFPSMHDRYLYAGDLLLWVRTFDTRRRGDGLCALVESSISLFSYMPMLGSTMPIPFSILAIFRLLCFAYLTMGLLKENAVLSRQILKTE